MGICDSCMYLRCCGWKKYPSESVIIIYFLKWNNQPLILLHQYHNRHWMLYLDCTRGYLLFDMLLAMVSVSNNKT